MTYKYTIINMLLIPCIIMSNNDAHMQDLKERRQQNEARLQELTKKITEKENLINSIADSVYIVLKEVIIDLDCHAKDELMAELNVIDSKLYKDSLTIENIKQLLEKSFLNFKEHKFFIERIKFSLIRRRIEYLYLSELFKSYNTCLEELFAIKNLIENQK